MRQDFYLVKEGDDGDPVVREYKGATLPGSGKFRDTDDPGPPLRILNRSAAPVITMTTGIQTQGPAAGGFKTQLRPGLYGVDGQDHIYQVDANGGVFWVTDPDTLNRLGGFSAVQMFSAGDGVRALFGVGQVGSGVSPSYVSSQRIIKAAQARGVQL